MIWLFFDTFPSKLRGYVQADSFEKAAEKMGCKPSAKRKNHVWVPTKISEYAGQEFKLIAFDDWWKKIREIEEPWQLNDLLRQYLDGH